MTKTQRTVQRDAINGLVWLKDAGCLGLMNQESAISRAMDLGHGQCDLTDNSKAGDWRLPNIDELKAIYSVESQFTNVKANYYWSFSTYASNTQYALGVGTGGGYVSIY